MKSIEERAKEYSKRQWDELAANKAYIEGAKEQKAKDIEVTILWLRVNWFQVRSDYPFNRLEDSFRTFMEVEL